MIERRRATVFKWFLLETRLFLLFFLFFLFFLFLLFLLFLLFFLLPLSLLFLVLLLLLLLEKRRARVDKWSVSETRLFFMALRQCGSDFTMIQRLFPGRTRKHI